ncbi:hypothetical protein BJ508DRAFT_376253 [Ascobolus immersus RN42]|uniref:Uncharacterized protein n=1 Tax=Ascobolus immersus RN42 TaxID=1160509 RepID=A0A3N4I858_ASCIM|nr:hypothetical protein BJ508DRAFT_376253 [Ascobolus immersus RN42]
MTTKFDTDEQDELQVSDAPLYDDRRIENLRPSENPDNYSIAWGYFVTSIRRKKELEWYQNGGDPLSGDLPDRYRNVPRYRIESDDKVTPLHELELLDKGWVVASCDYGLLVQQVEHTFGLRFAGGTPGYRFQNEDTRIFTCKEGHHVVRGMDWNECRFLSRDGTEATRLLTNQRGWDEVIRDPGRVRRKEQRKHYPALEAQFRNSYAVSDESFESYRVSDELSDSDFSDDEADWV